MRIAVLGWGSISWCPKQLQFKHEAESNNTYMGWRIDGPELPIEFARVSSDGRLTLVIQSGSQTVPVLWAESKCKSLEDARNNLAQREGMKAATPGIGVWPANNDRIFSVVETVKSWALDRKIDAVIWTALTPKPPKAGAAWSPTSQEVEEYIRGLDDEKLKVCTEYILNTPPQIRTALRPALEKVCRELQRKRSSS
ncbi:MAG: hypothetical protein KF754_04215 [Planctomycetes bacterium]|nr:hypothetical protein [Planctomycetota bacterium]